MPVSQLGGRRYPGRANVEDNATLPPAACSGVFPDGKSCGRQLHRQGMERRCTRPSSCLCARCFIQMERAGVAIDRRAALRQFGAMLSERIAACESRIFGYRRGAASTSIPPNSWARSCLRQLQLPPVLRKPRPATSTNARGAGEAPGHSIPSSRPFMDYRMLTKLKSTYADGLHEGHRSATAAFGRPSRTW